MRLKFLFSVFIVLSFLSFVLAENGEEGFAKYSNLEDILGDLEIANAYLSENPIIIPNGVTFLIKDGNLSAKISGENDASKDFYTTISKKRVLSVSLGLPEKSDYDLISDEQTINEIIQSDSPEDAIISAYKNKKIRIEANGIANNFKLFFGKLFLKFAI